VAQFAVPGVVDEEEALVDLEGGVSGGAVA